MLRVQQLPQTQEGIGWNLWLLPQFHIGANQASGEGLLFLILWLKQDLPNQKNGREENQNDMNQIMKIGRRYYLQVEWRNLKEMGIGKRERSEQVRGDKMWKPFTSGQEKSGGLYGFWAASHLQCSNPTPAATCVLHHKLHLHVTVAVTVAVAVAVAAPAAGFFLTLNGTATGFCTRFLTKRKYFFT